MLHEPHRYDSAFRLKLSPLLWLCLLYGLRHGAIALIGMLPPFWMELLGRWGKLQTAPMLLVTDVLVFAVLLLAGHRVPRTGPRLRACWHRGREMLLFAYGLDLVLFAALARPVLLAPSDHDFLRALTIVLADIAVLGFLLRSRLVRDIFADFPEAEDRERTRVRPQVRPGADPVSSAGAEDAETLHRMGLAAWETGRTDEAVTLIRKAIAKAPQNALYQRNVGEMCRRLRRLGEAVYFAESAIRLAPHDADAHYNLALCLADRKRIPEAINACLRTLELNPNHVAAWNNLGVLLQRQGRIASARQAFESALRIAPDHAEARINLDRLPPPLEASPTSARG